MTENRRRRSGRFINGEDILNTIKESTCGGTKSGKRVRSELPADPKGEGVTGIKVRFDRISEKYPSTVELRMTDGEWVEYQIVIKQPGFNKAMEQLQGGNWKTGYPGEKK